MWRKHHLLLVWVDEVFSRGLASFSGDFGGGVGNSILPRSTAFGEIEAIPSLESRYKKKEY